MIKAHLFRDGAPQELNADQEAQKRFMYEKMNPRRRRFIDRIGYENWDPYQKPNDPIELRTDRSNRNTQQLVREFLQSYKGDDVTNEFSQGVLECALGIINGDDRYRGVIAFCLWYSNLLEREGYLDERQV